MTVSDDIPEMSSEVMAVFDGIDTRVRVVLLAVRKVIFEVASDISVEGGVREYLAWGQPAYRPLRDGIGTAVRLAEHRPGVPALLVHCRTSLIEEFRTVTRQLDFDSPRAVLLDPARALPVAELRIMIEMALSYDRRRRALA